MGKELSGYGKVYKEVMFNTKLTYGARTLYAILCTYRDSESNLCYPGTESLCEALGTNNRTRINDWIQELESEGVIVRHTVVMPTRKNKRRTIEITDGNNNK